MWYGYLADGVVAVHLAYMAYIVLGQAAIVVAAPMRWQWARNPWFRLTHLLAIGVVVYEAVNNIPCPLTVWECQLREAGGVESSGETFVGRLLRSLLFIQGMPPVFFTTMYIAALVVVLQGLVMYPPRPFRWRRKA